MIDGTIAVSTLAHTGTSHSPFCNNLARIIWDWCLDHNIWLSTAYIPWKLNVLADKDSRNTNMGTEWNLNQSVYCDAIAKLGVKPDIDLFASRLNYKVKPFVAYQPDPELFANDAFTLSWESYFFMPSFLSVSYSISSSENSGGGGHRTHTSTQVASSGQLSHGGQYS